MTLNVWEGRGGDRGEVYKVEAEYLCEVYKVEAEYLCEVYKEKSGVSL